MVLISKLTYKLQDGTSTLQESILLRTKVVSYKLFSKIWSLIMDSNILQYTLAHWSVDFCCMFVTLLNIGVITAFFQLSRIRLADNDSSNIFNSGKLMLFLILYSIDLYFWMMSEVWCGAKLHTIAILYTCSRCMSTKWNTHLTSK